MEEEGQYQEEEFDERDETFLPPEQRRYGFEPKYACRSDVDRRIDLSPEARLYCSMLAFIESPDFPYKTEQIKKEWFLSAEKIVDVVKKLSPKYINYVNGPCLIIAYHLIDSDNLDEEMEKYVLKKSGIRTEKDIYRYVRFCRIKMGKYYYGSFSYHKSR